MLARVCVRCRGLCTLRAPRIHLFIGVVCDYKRGARTKTVKTENDGTISQARRSLRTGIELTRQNHNVNSYKEDAISRLLMSVSERGQRTSSI